MNFCPRCGSRLAPRSDGGRERRACPAGGCGFVHYGDHSIGAGAVVVRGDRVLLIERRSGERAWWQIPGGFVESDEAIDRAVEREVLEETGVSASVVEVLGFRHAPSQEPERTASNIYVVFRLDAIAGEPRPDGEESFDAGFFTRAEIEAKPGLSAMSLWAAAHAWNGAGGPALERIPERPGLQRPGHTLFGLSDP